MNSIATTTAKNIAGIWFYAAHHIASGYELRLFTHTKVCYHIHNSGKYLLLIWKAFRPPNNFWGSDP